MSDPVVIVDYDPLWPALYEREMELIRGVLGGRIGAIEHIGSTAVPDLAAKNIIDVMAGVSNIDEANGHLPLLAAIGYIEVIPQLNDAEWFYCLGKSKHGVGYHLHLVKFESQHWKKHVIFRDFLRKNPKACRDYCSLKRELAAKYGADRLGYTEAKTAFIESIVATASH